MSVLVEAWRQQTDLDDGDEAGREEWFPARLSTAMALVAKAQSSDVRSGDDVADT